MVFKMWTRYWVFVKWSSLLIKHYFRKSFLYDAKQIRALHAISWSVRICDGKRRENLFKQCKRWFWPANIVQSTCLLVEIHNSDPVTNILCFFIYNVNDNLDDLHDLELFQLMNKKKMRAKTMTLDYKQTHLHINH